jgi:hypothetical protein
MSGICSRFCLPPGGFEAVARCPGASSRNGNHIIDHAFHLLRLSAHFFRSGRGFFGGGGILLGDLVHFRDRKVHLFDALSLLRGCGRDFTDQFTNFYRAARYFLEGVVGGFYQRGAFRFVEIR